MFLYLVGRLRTLLFTLFIISFVSFFMVRLLPGDPVDVLSGVRGTSPELRLKIEKAYGLDKPLPLQYVHFLSRALKGSFGESIVTQQSVIEEFWQKFPATLELSFVAILGAILVAIPLGVIAAVKRNSWFDYSFITVSLIGYSMPIFWWGLLLILFFSVTLAWFPVSGRIGAEFDVIKTTGFYLIDTWFSSDKGRAFISAVKHLVLPCIALGTIPLAVTSRVTRSSLLEVLGEDYVRTAKAKGLPVLRVVGLHALRNSLIPIITTVGLQVSTAVTGAVLTESIFSWPGVGTWLVKAVVARDYPVVQGGILLIATAVIFVNFSVDIAYAIANPRVRTKHS